MKYAEFLRIAGLINDRLGVKPVLFGSLGLEVRLGVGLNADDIDILLPENVLQEAWEKLAGLMGEIGYTLADAAKREFEKDGLRVSCAPLEEWGPFAGIDTRRIPAVTDSGVHYLLPGLPDYLRIYEALSKAAGRREDKKKRDRDKLTLIRRAMGEDPPD